MNKMTTTQIESIKTSNPTLNELLSNYEHLDINEKLNLIAKISQYYIIEKGFSNKKYEPFFLT